jgi:hypothetical protein
MHIMLQMRSKNIPFFTCIRRRKSNHILTTLIRHIGNLREQPTMKQLDHIREHEIKGGPSFVKWFHTYVFYLFPPFSFLILVQIWFSFPKSQLFSM